MKVGELIRESIWRPNPRRDAAPFPLVSVLLPTYARADGGLFERAVRSVLDQTLTDIELIVVDDGSVDGTEDLIRQFMDEDARVHAIRHPVNVGLPAVSEFEAYQRARATYIGFAFDDDQFTREGLRALYELAISHRSLFVHGYTQYATPGDEPGAPPRFMTLGRRDANGQFDVPAHWIPELVHAGNQATCLRLLESINLIGNMSVLMHRQVVETVGFYDPHIVMLRACDWDLWRRVAARVPVDYCDVQVAIENADLRADSLGQTVGVDLQQMAEYVALPRDARLTPSRFAEFDVISVPDAGGARLAAYAEQCLRALQARGRMRRIPPPPPRKRIVLLYDQGTATDLLLDALPDEERAQFYVHQLNSAWDPVWPVLVNASAVVVCRRAADFAALRIERERREMDIPVYFYPGADAVPGNLPELIPDLAGLVLPASRAIEAGAPGSLILWPLSSPSESLETLAEARPVHDELHVGVVGDRDACRQLSDRLTASWGERAVSLRIHRHAGAEPEADVMSVEDALGWTQLVSRWRHAGVHALVIAGGASAETVFDGHAAILLAHLIGAAPVVAGCAALASLGDADGVVQADDVASALRALCDEPHRAALRERLRSYCRAAYAPGPAIEAARALLAAVPAADVLTAETRWRQLERWRTRTIVSQHENLRQTAATLKTTRAQADADRGAMAEAVSRAQALETELKDVSARADVSGAALADAVARARALEDELIQARRGVLHKLAARIARSFKNSHL